MRKFFECLSLCHTVQLDLSALVKFQASSPDEFSFVKFSDWTTYHLNIKDYYLHLTN